MKNIQPLIIAGLTIIIVGLAFYVYSMNSSIDLYKQEIEILRLKDEKVLVHENINNEIDDLLNGSEISVRKSDSIIKNIKHEIPKISDTNHVIMVEYIRNFRPKQD
jgi:hypothetical protein